MLLHADNVTSDPEIMREFRAAVEKLESVILPVSAAPCAPPARLSSGFPCRSNRLQSPKQLARQMWASIPPEYLPPRAGAGTGVFHSGPVAH